MKIMNNFKKSWEIIVSTIFEHLTTCKVPMFFYKFTRIWINLEKILEWFKEVVRKF